MLKYDKSISKVKFILPVKKDCFKNRLKQFVQMRNMCHHYLKNIYKLRQKVFFAYLNAKHFHQKHLKKKTSTLIEMYRKCSCLHRIVSPNMLQLLFIQCKQHHSNAQIICFQLFLKHVYDANLLVDISCTFELLCMKGFLMDLLVSGNGHSF